MHSIGQEGWSNCLLESCISDDAMLAQFQSQNCICKVHFAFMDCEWCQSIHDLKSAILEEHEPNTSLGGQFCQKISIPDFLGNVRKTWMKQQLLLKCVSIRWVLQPSFWFRMVQQKLQNIIKMSNLMFDMVANSLGSCNAGSNSGALSFELTKHCHLEASCAANMMRLGTQGFGWNLRCHHTFTVKSANRCMNSAIGKCVWTKWAVENQLFPQNCHAGDFQTKLSSGILWQCTKTIRRAAIHFLTLLNSIWFPIWHLAQFWVSLQWDCHQ